MKIHEFQVTTNRVRYKTDKKTCKRERIEETLVYKFKGCFKQNEKGDIIAKLMT